MFNKLKNQIESKPKIDSLENSDEKISIKGIIQDVKQKSPDLRKKKSTNRVQKMSQISIEEISPIKPVQKPKKKRTDLRKNTIERMFEEREDENKKFKNTIGKIDDSKQGSLSMISHSRRFDRSNSNISNMSRITMTTFLDKTIDEEGLQNLNQYIIMNTLGAGAFGKVKRAKNRHDKQYYVRQKLSFRRLRLWM
jgi:hypothetical protein